MSQTIELVGTSAGLTTSVTAYTSGDVLGTEMTLAGAFPIAGARAQVIGATFSDASNILAATDFFLFKEASTPAADNAANAWSDANMLNCVGVISFATADVLASANNKIATWHPAWPLSISGGTTTSLFVVGVTRSANTFFGAASDIQLRLYLQYP